MCLFAYDLMYVAGDKSAINKRYMYLTEDILKENPNVCEYMAPSLDARQDMVVVEVPRLGKDAAAKAIKEWGQPKSKITHVIFCTTSGVDMPGADASSAPGRLLLIFFEAFIELFNESKSCQVWKHWDLWRC